MVFKLNLAKAFTEGRLVQLRLTDAVQLSPAFKTAWLILSGMIYHVTATLSSIIVYNDGVSIFQTQVPAAEATGQFPLFNTLSDVTVAQFPIVIVTGNKKGGKNSYIELNGAANVAARLQALEWEMDE